MNMCKDKLIHFLVVLVYSFEVLILIGGKKIEEKLCLKFLKIIRIFVLVQQVLFSFCKI
ncbi:protein of unknown function [Bartonella clarridgeiae 73]|uniref:Uncharacterized protein n=1 Tax=Bartonella clarridgeiae (strain CCUG 45776 / CIP 104772 / 73) TaxID=696125 RepID=E6YG37_BARC7|nr:protein of unknown function [Bartonella clarridgeiae 73]